MELVLQLRMDSMKQIQKEREPSSLLLNSVQFIFKQYCTSAVLACMQEQQKNVCDFAAVDEYTCSSQLIRHLRSPLIYKVSFVSHGKTLSDDGEPPRGSRLDSSPSRTVGTTATSVYCRFNCHSRD